MSLNNDIYNEWGDLNPEFDKGNKFPFNVPQGYFEGLPGNIINRIKQLHNTEVSEEINQLSPLLSGIGKVMPYYVPAGYWENNPELDFVWLQDPANGLREVIGTSHPFHLPDGYFDELPQLILTRVQNRRARVIPILSTSWLNKAVAAIIAGIISISVFTYLEGYHRHSADVAANITLKKVPLTELDNFLKNIGASGTSQTAQNSNNPGFEVKKMLGEVSVNELDLFLKQVPSESVDLNNTN